MLIMSAVSGFGIGWGRPVQVNPSRLRYGPSVGMGIVAAAGPISNVVIAVVCAIAYLVLKIPLGTLLGAYTIWVMLNDEVIKAFNPPRQ